MNSPRFEFGTHEPAFNRWSIRGEKEEKEGKKEEDKKPEIKPKEKSEEKGQKTPPRTAKAEKDSPKKEESSEKVLSAEEKQEKRTEIIERSLEYKKQFEQTPVPKDPSTVARLIVAEHILELDEQIREPGTKNETHTKEELEETLDYMCRLAEKLEDPSVESPPQIQDAYETLIELTEEMLNESEYPEEVINQMSHALETGEATLEQQFAAPAAILSTPQAPHANDSLSRSPLPARPSTTPAPTAPTAMTLIAFLKQASKRNDTASASLTINPSRYLSGDNRVSRSRLHLPTHENVPNAPPLSSAPQQPFSDTLPESHLPHAEKFHNIQPNIARPLAAIALTSAVAIHKSPEISHRHEPSAEASSPSPFSDNTPLPITSHIEKGQTQSRTYKPEYSTYDAQAPAQPEHSTQPAYREASAAHENRKLEHLPLLSLLTLAKDIRLGYGRYLKDEFERGHIDKAGLIKVLKAKKKGLDVSKEYTTQSGDYQKRKISFEFLSRSPASQVATEEKQETTPSAHGDMISEESPQTKDAEFTHPILKRYARPEKTVFQTPPKSPIPINLIVTVAAVIVFGIIFLSLLLPVLA